LKTPWWAVLRPIHQQYGREAERAKDCGFSAEHAPPGPMTELLQNRLD
jgi:hypothetical protein